MSTFSQFTGVGGIKSIQRGTIAVPGGAMSQTATISSVNTSKSELRFLGSSVNAATLDPRALVYIELTNSTTIRASRGASVAPNVQTTVAWELTEFN